MIDICFSDSVTGMLKCVRKEIKTDGIFPLWMTMNCGELQCDDLMEQQIRIEIGYSKYFDKSITDEDLEEEIQAELKKDRKMIGKIKRFLDEGHSVRVWFSNIAKDRCGLYFLCNVLKEYSNEILLIPCPGFEYDNITKKSVERRNWAAFSDLDCLIEHSDKYRVMSAKERIAYADRWEGLVQENAPLRILVDDMIVSVGEDFFDDVILSFVTAEPKVQNNVMGEMLGRWQSGDIYFISKRIERLIEQNKIKVCEERKSPSGCYWGRTIALV